MTKALSLYLDGLRFVAAFTVFLAHYSIQRISGGFFWPSFAYGHTAVLVFFVLSGFVIAWVTETREHGLEDYVLSRAARLASGSPSIHSSTAPCGVRLRRILSSGMHSL
jgi:peptidoglycan/LPS O-acetylase OafA/YrhL